jgi:hypothetical protein
MIPDSEIKSWTRQLGDTTYLCSTDPKYIDLEALNATLGSGLLWWAKSLHPKVLEKIVQNSLCLGLYIPVAHESFQNGGTKDA